MASSADVDAPRWRLRLAGGRQLELGGRTRVMGVVNVTPDSFSDGGRFLAPERAIAHGLALVAAGADLLDLGAESTRPGGGVYGDGAREVPASEELDRLLPVVEGLRRETAAPLSVDTRKAAVAEAALAAGADLVNDVGCLASPELAVTVARAGCPLVVMHSRGEIATMQRDIRFADVVAEVAAELRDAGARAVAAGIDAGQVILDPGLGFGKTAEQNLELLAALDRLATLGRPLLVGASRKSFLAHAARDAPPPDDRLGGGLAAVAWAAHHGVALVRVHDVAATVQFLDVWNAIHWAAPGRPSERRGEARRERP